MRLLSFVQVLVERNEIVLHSDILDQVGAARSLGLACNHLSAPSKRLCSCEVPPTKSPSNVSAIWLLTLDSNGSERAHSTFCVCAVAASFGVLCVFLQPEFFW